MYDYYDYQSTEKHNKYGHLRYIFLLVALYAVSPITVSKLLIGLFSGFLFMTDPLLLMTDPLLYDGGQRIFQNLRQFLHLRKIDRLPWLTLPFEFLH